MLIGIKDTDDNLVASTLICLSELVPILGADTVVGGKRSKLFTDGRPNSKPAEKAQEINIFSTKSLRDLPCSEEIYHGDTISPTYEKVMSLNERPSPVGGESIENEPTVANEIFVNLESDDDWSDWDNSNRQLTISNPVSMLKEGSLENTYSLDTLNHIDTNKNFDIKPETKVEPVTRTSLMHKAALDAKRNIVDISELDIKNQKFEHSNKNTDEFDFFADMMPVIEKPTIINVTESEEPQRLSSKLNFVPAEGLEETEGWGGDWNE